MKKKILFVENHETIDKAISTCLSSDYECIHFSNGIKAIEWLYNNDLPDIIIISDILMQEMKADEFLLYLKEKPSFHSIPIMILPNEDNPIENKDWWLEKGATDYITRPLNPEELKNKLTIIFDDLIFRHWNWK